VRKTILLTFVTAVVIFWIGSGIVMTVMLAPEAGSKFPVGDSPSGFAGIPTSALVREVTAYNVGRRNQTGDSPCIGATGQNLCRLITQGLRICAANFVAPKTILNIEGYGECVVLDRMHRRFSHRVDIAMGEEEVGKALEFGSRRLQVEVKSALPEKWIGSR